MLAAFFRNLLRKKQTEQELDDELRAYLELTTAENVRGGMSSEGALQKARRDLGGMEQVKESVRDVRVGVSLRKHGRAARIRCPYSAASNPAFRSSKRKPNSTASRAISGASTGMIMRLPCRVAFTDSWR